MPKARRGDLARRWAVSGLNNIALLLLCANARRCIEIATAVINNRFAMTVNFLWGWNDRLFLRGCRIKRSSRGVPKARRGDPTRSWAVSGLNNIAILPLGADARRRIEIATPYGLAMTDSFF